MLDRSFIGMEFPPRIVSVEEGQLRFFAAATGESDAIYIDIENAKRAGHRSLPAPPTFAFSLSLLARSQNNWASKVGLRTENALHGEQTFQYFKPIYAGDVITLTGRIADIYEKKGGALEFVVIETSLRNQKGDLCVQMQQIGVSRNSVVSA